MQIVLSAQQTKILEALSQQGGYRSLEDAIDTALILLADDIAQHHPNPDPDYLAWVEQTRRKIDEGVQDAEQGNLLDAEDVLTHLCQKINAARVASE